MNMTNGPPLVAIATVCDAEARKANTGQTRNQPITVRGAPGLIDPG